MVAYIYVYCDLNEVRNKQAIGESISLIVIFFHCNVVSILDMVGTTLAGLDCCTQMRMYFRCCEDPLLFSVETMPTNTIGAKKDG